ncbi:MAG: magnesium transporter [Dehalococcoidia bacterium]
MTTEILELIDDLKQYVQEQEWDKAIDLLSQFRAPDQAQAFTELDRAEQKELFPNLDEEKQADLFEHLKKEDVRRLSQEIDRDTLLPILDNVGPDVAADVLQSFPPQESHEILEGMEEKEQVSPLLSYSEDTAGGLMTPEVLTLPSRMTAARALDRLRRLKPPQGTVEVLYVVDRRNRPQGTLTLRQLILADPEEKISEVMNPDVIFVTADTDREECARIMSRHDLSALPVIDDEGRLLGIIRLKESLEVAEEEATEDMYHMVGVSENERILTPFRDSIRRRLPWLSINLGTAILAGVVVGLFESTIAQVAALAVFIPVIAGQGGNAGAQTLTIMVRSLALGEVSFRNAKRALFKELGLAAINGLVIAVIAGNIAFFWKDDLWLAVVLGGAMFATMIVAGLSGVVIPLLLKLMKVDPALGSTVVVTTITDTGGLLIMLGMATLMISYLV